MNKRKLFCEISPVTYKISVTKCRIVRHIQNCFMHSHFARNKQSEPLPYLVFKNRSLIRRTLKDVDPVLQENKAVNLALAAPHVHGILIYPEEVFSFWTLVKKCSAKKGYREGLTISQGVTHSGTGGGMCQFTNLIHWLVLHSDLDIVEYHHHDGYDLFPDDHRKVPFGTGTSILYNYLDYRFKNNTDKVYQLLVWVDETHLNAELRASKPLDFRVEISCEDECFTRENGIVYRNGSVVRKVLDLSNNEVIESKIIKKNHARVLYDTSFLEIKEFN